MLHVCAGGAGGAGGGGGGGGICGGGTLCMLQLALVLLVNWLLFGVGV
jgi:hypothetical protein